MFGLNNIMLLLLVTTAVIFIAILSCVDWVPTLPSDITIICSLIINSTISRKNLKDLVFVYLFIYLLF